MTKLQTDSSQFPVGTGLKVVSVISVIFGLMTLFSAGNVLFGPQSARVLAGDYIPFVVWFNFGAGIFYITAGAGIWTGRHWAKALSILIALATGITGLIFTWNIYNGEAYEMRTVGAMIVRTGFWSVISFLVWRAWR